jgi:ubiquinone/menaquinone biosynthesis C-methylase UbiE
LTGASADAPVSTIFNDYARCYDDLYQDKDYEAETDFVEALFKRHLARPPVSVLDVACGTGGHAIPLARRGYSLTGVDLSAGMIEQAQKKALAAGLKIRFDLADMRELALEGEFDAVLCMFASIGYMPDAEALNAALRAMRRRLRAGGVLIFDFWNGAAVLRDYEPYRLKRASAASGRSVTRLSTVTVDSKRQVCSIRLEGFVRQGSQILGEFDELHDLRFYSPQEMSKHIRESGLELLQMTPAGDPDGNPTESTWSITVVARAT